MSDLALGLIAFFASIALLSGAITSVVLAKSTPGRKRLLGMLGDQAHAGSLAGDTALSEKPSAQLERLAKYVPKSPKEMGRIRKRLSRAGIHGLAPAIIYGLAEVTLAVLGFVIVFFVTGARTGLLFGLAGAVVGYMIPGFIVARRIRLRMKQIQNGLPDALDLLIVSLEAGLALDHAILKCSEELQLAYPALAHEMSLINIETRAGKPRLEALKNFATRTQVDDVRALVAMLVQTERFGTSVAQALRTHAEVSRTKRRQRAEEKAAKLSVKLIFPLVFCLLPAFFVISVGPAIIKFVQFFGNLQIPGGLQ